MNPEHVKTAISGAWVVSLAALALSVNITSVTGWMLVAGVGLLPPLVLLRMWRQPAPSMSESIRNVTR